MAQRGKWPNLGREAVREQTAAARGPGTLVTTHPAAIPLQESGPTVKESCLPRGVSSGVRPPRHGTAPAARFGKQD